MEKRGEKLLDPAFLRKLERLRVSARRAFPGTMRGERRSTRRGSSVEFSDFRKYEAGDDFRHVDWNIYARLERLMLRQFTEEEDVRIDILIDQSRSMHFGEPVTKFDFARKAAAALAFLAISSLDRASVSVFDSSLRTRVRPLRGRGHLVTILSFLDSLSTPDSFNRADVSAQAAGEEREQSLSNELPIPHTNLSAALRAFQRANSRPGILFIISDFLDPGDFQSEMKLLAHRGFDLNVIQVLSPEEISPEAGGDLLVVDSETGEAREITLNDRAVAAYRAALSGFTASLETFCRAHSMGYMMLASDASFEDLLLKNLIESKMAE